MSRFSTANLDDKNVARFLDSDLRSINLDNLLRVWLSQLIDNAMQGKPSYVEVRMYNKGANGFDIVDNGSGYTQSNLATICKCFPQRERNEIYKTKSIGHQGEALNSLCKSSRVQITTKHNDEKTGLKAQFGVRGEITALECVEMASTGTLVEIRDIFRNNF